MHHVALIEVKQGIRIMVASGTDKQDILSKIDEKYPLQGSQSKCLFYRTFIEEEEANNFEKRLIADKDLNLKKLIQSENPELRDLFNLIP